MSASVLQRANQHVSFLMTMNENLTNVVIQDLTFDGNRSVVQSEIGNSVFCQPSFTQNQWIDLNLSNYETSIVTVQYVDFINAPSAGAEIDGTYNLSNSTASTISYSNWAAGGPSTAGRATGVFLVGDYTGAYYNTIEYQGTAAINSYQGSGQYIYGNTAVENRYEMSDGVGGGQIFTGSTSDTAVAANWIDGKNYVTNGSTINGCPTVVGQSPTGLEVYGSYQAFYDNQVQNHYGIGIEMYAGSASGYNAPSNITFSGLNPWNPSDAYRCTSYSGWRGMYFHGTGQEQVAVTLNAVCVTYTGLNGYTGTYGIELNYVTGTGFTDNACLHSNDAEQNNSSYNILTGTDVSLTNPLPGNTTSCYSQQ